MIEFCVTYAPKKVFVTYLQKGKENTHKTFQCETKKSSQLSDEITTLINLVGKEKTLKLERSVKPCKSTGRRMLYVPQKASADHIIAQQLGMKSMETICKYLGGLTVYFQKTHDIEKRNKAISLLINKHNIPMSALADACGMSRQHLYRVKGKKQ